MAKTSSRERLGASSGRRSSPTTPATDRAAEALGARPHHGSTSAGVGERRDAAYALVVRRRGRQGERPAEAEAASQSLGRASSDACSRIGARSLRHWDAENVPGAPADARERARRDDPSRLVRQVVGELGQRPGGLATQPMRARQPVAR